jgi:hypothetical protein
VETWVTFPNFTFMITQHLIVLLVMTALCCARTFAQERFKVLACRGTVSLQSGAKPNVGAKIQATDKIMVGKGGYISLCHTSGKTHEIKKEGTYKVTELDKKVASQKGSATSKFASYVVRELTEVDEPVQFSRSRKTSMRTTGAVERAAGNEVNVWDSVFVMVGSPGELEGLAMFDSYGQRTGEHFSVVMPRHTRLLSDTVTFIWHRSPKLSSYRFVLTNRSNQVVFQQMVADTMMVVPLLAKGALAGELHHWHIEDPGNPDYRTEEQALYILQGAEREGTLGELQQVQMQDSEDAVAHLVAGVALEDLGLVYDAYREFDAAIRSAPGITSYKRLYAQFLQRNGLYSEAYTAYTAP